MIGPPRRIAVVLFNLGGPDGPAAVRPFLENLFNDPAIIGARPWVRRPLAAGIARLRARSARANYAVMGGRSPILANTLAQAAALRAALAALAPAAEIEVFIAMRHWSPTTQEAALAVASFAPDQIVLAPLYPQFSTTTTASSLRAWRAAYRGAGVSSAICCWYDNPGLVQAHAEAISQVWKAAGEPPVRLLFSAHGLPRRVAQSGDPYQWQVESTCAAIVERLGAGWDWRVCYQSRVGPAKWLEPSTVEAIRDAGRAKMGVLIDPVSFVCEHVETLVELDRDYAAIAGAAGATPFLRAPAMGVRAPFVEGLAKAIERALGHSGLAPDGLPCPAEETRCALRDLELCF
jgi:ferrochelatase